MKKENPLPSKFRPQGVEYLIQNCRKTIKSYLLDVNFCKLKVKSLQFRMERLLVVVRNGGRFMKYIKYHLKHFGWGSRGGVLFLLF